MTLGKQFEIKTHGSAIASECSGLFKVCACVWWARAADTGSIQRWSSTRFSLVSLEVRGWHFGLQRRPTPNRKRFWHERKSTTPGPMFTTASAGLQRMKQIHDSFLWVIVVGVWYTVWYLKLKMHTRTHHKIFQIYRYSAGQLMLWLESPGIDDFSKQWPNMLHLTSFGRRVGDGSK